jgi:hypothetical protein
MQEPEFTIIEGITRLTVKFTDRDGRVWDEAQLQAAIDLVDADMKRDQMTQQMKPYYREVMK